MFDSDSLRFAQRALAEAAEIQRQLQPALDQFREATAQIAAYEQSMPAGMEDQLRAVADFNRRLDELGPSSRSDWLVMPPTAADEIRELRATARDEIRLLREEVVELRQQLARPPVKPVQPPPDDDDEWPHTEIRGFRL